MQVSVWKFSAGGPQGPGHCITLEKQPLISLGCSLLCLEVLACHSEPQQAPSSLASLCQLGEADVLLVYLFLAIITGEENSWTCHILFTASFRRVKSASLKKLYQQPLRITHIRRGKD